MFDNSPQTSVTGQVAGVALSPYNTGARKMFHYLENIYDPDKHDPSDIGKYEVPQEGEIVFDVPNGNVYWVSHVDWQATLKTTLSLWTINNVAEGQTAEQNWIFGLRGGPMAGEALLSIDFSVRPNQARIDSTIMRPGAAYALLFDGDDVSDPTNIISAQYDQAGNMLNNRVPTKLAEIIDRTNEMIMTTGAFSVTKNAQAMPDGKRCWVVFYDAGGNYIPPAQPLMVQHSSYMKDHQIGMKYVTSIELLSPWFTNTSDPYRLNIPQNVNLLSIEFRAAVNYSDGSREILPVNSGKFWLRGLREYRPSFPGQTSTLTLTYKLDPNEQFYMASPGSPDHKSVTYVLEAGAVKGAYSPKIYTYPQWDAGLVGYKLLHFLYDLDRQSFVNVTNLVTLNSQSPAYNPALYGVTQNLIFNLNLRDVSPSYESITFIQYTEIALRQDLNGTDARWEVGYEATKPVYKSLFAAVRNDASNTTVNLTNGFATQAEWLDALYWAVSPGYNALSELKAPLPTHFYIMHEDGRKWRFALDAWNRDNVVPIEFQNGKTIMVNWVNKDISGNELQLATTGVVVDVL